jgi:hypothetical protein
MLPLLLEITIRKKKGLGCGATAIIYDTGERRHRRKGRRSDGFRRATEGLRGFL